MFKTSLSVRSMDIEDQLNLLRKEELVRYVNNGTEFRIRNVNDEEFSVLKMLNDGKVQVFFKFPNIKKIIIPDLYTYTTIREAEKVFLILKTIDKYDITKVIE